MQNMLPKHQSPQPGDSELGKSALSGTKPPAFRALVFGLRRHLALLLFTGFGVLGTYVFYAQPDVRQHVDDYFFDLETRMKPSSQHIADVMLVDIDHVSLEAFGQTKLISPNQLLNVITKLRQTKAAIIALLLPENVLDYSAAAVTPILRLIASDPRFVVGVLGYNRQQPSLRQLPLALQPIKERVYGIDMLRQWSNDVVRRHAYSSYLGLEEKVMLPVAMAHRFRVLDTRQVEHRLLVDPGEYYYLNFEPQSAFATINAARFADLSATSAEWAEFDGKVVVMGYTQAVAWPFVTNEQLSANTPLKFDLSTYAHGESLTVLIANATENLLHDRVLNPAPLAVRLCHTLLCCGLTLLLWSRGAIAGSLGVSFGLWGLVGAQSLLMSYAAIYIPMADTLLFAGLASMFGAWQGLQKGIRQYADARSLNERSREIALVRSEFLERFADELSRINQHIGAMAAKLTIPSGAAQVFNRAHRQLIGCTEEFADYIAGIAQVSRLSVAQRRPDKAPFNVEQVLHDVAERFAALLQEKEMHLSQLVTGPMMVDSNANIVDKILFNFVSNAVKYSPAGTNIDLKVEDTNHSCKIHVIDRGPGIAPEHQNLIFEQFYRVRNDDSYRIRGSGLGLYLCRYFAGLIGATIELESKLGEGSTFSLVLPR